ncbi:MAG TPA: hypothetical protein VFS21_22720 [Roseiflexaceae bacterium]|nr:hypothetical protein [Roseiflexaceae bacterium]
MSLTTIQRDLLCQLLAAEQPASAAALGAQLRLTPRQVQYGLREIRPWLSRRNLTLQNTPGVGVQLLGEPAQKRALLAELSGKTRLQLILSADQRQQLLALRLLCSPAPAILGLFGQDLAVSRATVLKDLEVVEGWLGHFRLRLARRQHRGFWVDGTEHAQRQALAALLWGDLPWDRPLIGVGHGPAISFALAQDAALLPMVAEAGRLVRAIDLAAAADLVVWAEAELGGQFTEEALRWLTLALAIQQLRVAGGQHAAWEDGEGSWARAQPVWSVAAQLANALWPALPAAPLEAETVALAVLFCAAPRDESPSAAPRDATVQRLVGDLLGQIARHYGLPDLAQDELLRAGLEALLPPACVRQRFRLWWPRHADAQSEAAPDERALAARLSGSVQAVLGAGLPPEAEDELILLLRAGVVRARPERARRVLVVCPSGMATTQLLVARLRARLPRLGTFEVLPMRALTAERVADADLIISTVPLPGSAGLPVAVVQVHPSLRSEDIAALMQWMG